MCVCVCVCVGVRMCESVCVRVCLYYTLNVHRCLSNTDAPVRYIRGKFTIFI